MGLPVLRQSVRAFTGSPYITFWSRPAHQVCSGPQDRQEGQRAALQVAFGGVVGTKLIDGKQITPEEINRVYHRRLHELWEAYTGYITEHHVFTLHAIRSEGIISLADVRIREIPTPCDNVPAPLKEVSGLGDKVVEDLVAEIGSKTGKKRA